MALPFKETSCWELFANNFENLNTILVKSDKIYFLVKQITRNPKYFWAILETYHFSLNDEER
jgi:hypothetical protein